MEANLFLQLGVLSSGGCTGVTEHADVQRETVLSRQGRNVLHQAAVSICRVLFKGTNNCTSPAYMLASACESQHFIL